MAYSGPDTGNITINGLSPASWALEIFLPPLVPSILGQAVAIFVCYWEFVVLFPSEVQIWRRLMRRPFHWQFAPSMTLFMRYTLLCYASAAAFTQYSTTMTDSACTGASTVFVISVICLNTSSVICMAWRSHAVAMGVIERPKIRWAVRACVGFMLTAAIVLVWYAFINAQFHGSWTPRAENGVCVSEFAYKINKTDVASSPIFWYYVVSILFDATCMLTICLSLKKLARRSSGFSKLIKQLVYHSLGYFIIIFLLFLLGIIWLRVQNAYWAANFIQMVQASIVIRILISEQKKAQRPHDTSFLEDGYASGYGADTRTCPGLGAETYDEGYASDSRFGPHQGRSAISRRPVLSGRSSGRDEEEGYEMKESVKDENLPSVQHHDLPPTRPKEVDLAPHRQHSETEEQQDPAHVEGRSGSERGGGGGDSGMHVRAPLRQQDSDYGGSTAISSDDGVAAGARGFAASADNRGHRADHPRTAPSKVNTTTSNDGDGNKHGTQFIAVEVLQR